MNTKETTVDSPTPTNVTITTETNRYGSTFTIHGTVGQVDVTIRKATITDDAAIDGQLLVTYRGNTYTHYGPGWRGKMYPGGNHVWIGNNPETGQLHDLGQIQTAAGSIPAEAVQDKIRPAVLAVAELIPDRHLTAARQELASAKEAETYCLEQVEEAAVQLVKADDARAAAQSRVSDLLTEILGTSDPHAHKQAEILLDRGVAPEAVIDIIQAEAA